ncbi:MAG TPA: type II toxin-antitoxin system VapC family toxin [Solirubrobacterales bacterium]
MLTLDSSALVSVLCHGEGSEWALPAMEAAPGLAIGAPTLSRANDLMLERLDLLGGPLLSHFLQRAEIAVIAFDERHRRAAASASVRFGAGRHPAALDSEDCRTYATARLTGSAVLAVGRRFSLTDLPIAAE